MTRPPTVLVVGAGASGSLFARRLLDRSEAHVIVLESGPVWWTAEDAPPAVRNASRLEAAVPGQPFNETYRVWLRDTVPYDIVRGRTLGGSTAINGAYCVQAPPEDWNRWALQIGDARWADDAVRAARRAVETDREFGEQPGHGESGPVSITRSSLDHPLGRAFLAAAVAHGGVPFDDVVGVPPPSIGALPRNHTHGVRMNAGWSALYPVRDSPRLEVRGQHRVHRLLVQHNRDQPQVVGVTGVTDSGESFEYLADHVVVTAGALESAALLLRSGLGPERDLHERGISVLHDLPAVGAQSADHPSVRLDWWPSPDHSDLGVGVDPFFLVAQLGHSTLGEHAGIPAIVEVLPVARPLPELLVPQSPGLGGAQPSPHSVLLSLMTPLARGTLRLVSADPTVAPEVHCNALTHPGDVAALFQGALWVEEVLGDTAFSPLFGSLVSPPSEAVDHEEWLLQHLGTSYHMTSTVPAGPPGQGAVDSRGRVYGVSGLRVADVSILPDGPTRGPAHTAMTLGVLAADWLIDEL